MGTRELMPAERLIVAADFSKTGPGARRDAYMEVMRLADQLHGTGIYLKVNSALRACGYDLIDMIHERGLRVFADLKLNDIDATMATDGGFLAEARPEILTVMCSSGMKGLHALRSALLDTEILGVTVLTNFDTKDCLLVYGREIWDTAGRFATMAAEAKLGGVIASGAEAQCLRSFLPAHMTINTPNIRPTWAVVPGDDQNKGRSMTPADAIRAGADRIVVGRPITQAKDPRDAVRRTIEEIAIACEKVAS